MSLDRVVEGSSATIQELFLDEFDMPVDLANNEPGPRVRLIDSDKDVVSEVYAVPAVTEEPGTWAASLPVPELNLTEPTEFLVTWYFRSSDGDVYRAKAALVVEPANEHRISDISVVAGVDTNFEVNLPHVYNEGAGDVLEFSLFYNNEARYTAPIPASDPSVTIHVGLDQTTATLGLGGFVDPTLEPMILFITYKKPGASAVRYDYKVWHITPQIIVAASMLEDWINKARIENVIPQLEYTQSDLISYLQRGLALFNSYGTLISNFDGTNMQGPILDGWLVMASYYALGAQLQAEGALAFDFSGQTVNLNVDRTPSIEAALGRVESQMENAVKPLKKLLSRYGITGGSGAQGGGKMSGYKNLGTLQILNAPTSRVGYTTSQYNNRFRRR